MKRFFCLILSCLLILSLCACGKPAPAPTLAPAVVPDVTAMPTETPAAEPTPAPTPTPDPLPLIPDLPEIHDAALEEILGGVLNIGPGSAGSSLRAAAVAARLLDWGMETALSDDEIYAAMGSYLDTLSDADFMLFRESFYAVYDRSYDLRGEYAEGLLSDAGVADSAYPWNDQAFHVMEMLCYGLGPQ